MHDLSKTLHGVLGCKCSGRNCFLKSLYVLRVIDGKAEIEAEPYDEAYGLLHFDETIEKIERIIWRRRKAIFKALNADAVAVSIFNEYTMQAAFNMSAKNDRIDRVS